MVGESCCPKAAKSRKGGSPPIATAGVACRRSAIRIAILKKTFGSTTRLVQTEPLAAGFFSSITKKNGSASLHFFEKAGPTTPKGKSIFGNGLGGEAKKTLVRRKV